eukprot:CAMPEP_0117668298 /NCGR_PEP_ID=MMETSP0804-20121206/11467_1 /TAXON_ID=1074897 /ORGANISM="Tetraselmis astigmatica, Strain CCMP880" /LENGTH=175 /DNA_ID=CAMNT_0005476165 /DNA_START=252 /DNA_END=779 /DNA_ORIENTATION=+
MALALKMATLALKTLAKPVAGRMQAWALGHPYWRGQLINMAQTMHRVEVRITRGAEGKEGKAFVGQMTEEKAMELASKLVSEGFVFSVGAGVVVYEYVVSRKKEAAKAIAAEHSKRQEMDRAAAQRAELLQENERQNRLLKELSERLESLEAELHKEQEPRQRRTLFGLLPASLL